MYAKWPGVAKTRGSASYRYVGRDLGSGIGDWGLGTRVSGIVRLRFAPSIAPTISGTSPVPRTASISGICAFSSSRYRSPRQPVTTSRLQLPFFLNSASSRIVLTDSSFAESMNAQVLTTSTSASDGFGVSVWPPSCDSPIMTSESTRFFGQPSETKPIFMA